MAQKEYIVEDRAFRTESDYKRALRDQETMQRLRKESAGYSKAQLEQLLDQVHQGKYRFFTLLGQDFEDELTERIRRAGAAKAPSGKSKSKQTSGGKKSSDAGKPAVSDEAVQTELKNQEKRRKWTLVACAGVAVLCLGYFGFYLYYNQRTSRDVENLIALKDKEPIPQMMPSSEEFVIHYTEDEEIVVPEVLDEYKNLLNKNKKLIGWIKIDDTNIDYPVMQTSDNEYYLEHNINQEYDKNGTIFMDKDCDVLKPSTNLILYGHHMKSGKMFGGLDKYSDPKYYMSHRYIDFDTIYEKGIYEVMYVFRSRVYSEEEVVFKYYQFIDAVSEREFDSNMNEMAAVSLYDTGVTASYGDRLLTLSTCDYQEKNGRFVVVAKRVSEKE